MLLVALLLAQGLAFAGVAEEAGAARHACAEMMPVAASGPEVTETTPGSSVEQSRCTIPCSILPAGITVHPPGGRAAAPVTVAVASCTHDELPPLQPPRG